MKGRVRQGLLKVCALSKAVTKALLELFEFVSGHGPNYKPCRLFLATESHPAEFS
jgi:hypothetical protein